MDSLGGSHADRPGYLRHITSLEVWSPHPGTTQEESPTEQMSQDGETKRRNTGRGEKDGQREQHPSGENDPTRFRECLIPQSPARLCTSSLN